MIDCFDGEFAFLSNFYEHPIQYQGIVYPTNEHFFQAMKSVKEDERKMIAAAPTPGKAKRLGRAITLRSDWEIIKYDIMLLGLRLKFCDKELREKLRKTGDEILIEGNTWHDNTWGDCSCERCCTTRGRNELGRLLMQVRNEI